LPEAVPSVTEEQISAALLAARVLRGLDATDRAVQLLWAAARSVRLRPERTFFALWLVEIAEQWLEHVTSERLRCQVLAELGNLVAQTGDKREGIGLVRN